MLPYWTMSDNGKLSVKFPHITKVQQDHSERVRDSKSDHSKA